MKLLFDYLTHSMKESESVVKSSKSNGTSNKTTKGVGNNKNGKLKPSTSCTQIKKFFGFKVSGKSSSKDGMSPPKSDKKQRRNSQSNGTSKKSSTKESAKSSPNSKKSSPSKSSPSKLGRKKAASLSTSASASAKKRAIERALKKSETASKKDSKRKLSLKDKPLKKSKKKLTQVADSADSTRKPKDGRGRKKSSVKVIKSKRGRKKKADSAGGDGADRPRPRRRASQTYFIKYQLARNPLKAEEEDLKLALLASLEQCGPNKSSSSKKQQKLLNDLLIQEQANNHGTNSKTTKHNQRESHQKKQPRKKNPKHPNKQVHSKTSSLSIAQNIAPVTPATVATSKPPSYDEEYLEKYRPDTEDFLTFICFRVTAPNVSIQTTNDHKLNEITANQRCRLENGYSGLNNSSSITGSLNIKIEPNINVGSCSKQATCSTSSCSTLIDDQQDVNLRRSVSPCKINSNSSSNTSNQLYSPLSNRRRPATRQSPRLANSTNQQKISDSHSEASLNRAQQIQINCNTALYQNQIMNYEENLKKASIALEDMAQEITKRNGTDTAICSNTRQQNGKSSQGHSLLLSTADAIEKNSHYDHRSKSTSNTNPFPYKNNKHLVKGLMTREFAGTFADEEIIFESISNHKL